MENGEQNHLTKRKIALEAQLKDLQNLKLSAQLINKRDNRKDNHRKALTLLKNKVQPTARIRKTGQTNDFKNKMRNGKRYHPRIMNQNKNKLAPKHFTGASTT